MSKIENIKKEKIQRHLINIREAIKSLKGTLRLLEDSDIGLDKEELKRELEALEGKEKELILKLKKLEDREY